MHSLLRNAQIYFFQKQILHKVSQLKHPFISISVPERKLLIIFWTFVFSTVVNLTLFSELARKNDVFKAALSEYFSCELNGHDPDNPCDRGKVEFKSEVLSILSLVTTGCLLPLANLVFVISFEGLKKSCSQARAKISAITMNSSMREGQSGSS